jgi:protein-S-isoprenylcysteine O-methyltransferase Ste14
MLTKVHARCLNDTSHPTICPNRRVSPQNVAGRTFYHHNHNFNIFKISNPCTHKRIVYLTPPMASTSPSSFPASDNPTASKSAIRSFSDIYYYVNIAYWTTLFLSLLVGQITGSVSSTILQTLASFANYTLVMFLISSFLCGWSAISLLYQSKIQGKNTTKMINTSKTLLYLFNTVFWLSFVLWHGPLPPFSAEWTLYTGTAGAVMVIYGLALALFSSLQTGMWTVMGSPQVPKKLATSGLYKLTRHPQALGNMLFLIGFSLSGGAYYAAAGFAISFLLYARSVVPEEEGLLEGAFPGEYVEYKKRVPAFQWGLALLLLVEVAIHLHLQPWSVAV